MQRSTDWIGIFVLVCALALPDARATVVVVPDANLATGGPTGNSLPFNLGASGLPSARYQQVYASSAFTAFGGPALITQIAFSPDPNSAAAFSATLANVQIDLSTTSAAVDGLSNYFASNVGADDTIVHSGSLALSSSFTGPVGGPKDFDIVIPLAAPFYYDPALGNLLLDVRNYSGETTTYFEAFNATTDRVSRITTFFDGDVDSDSAFTDTAGLVTQFTATPAPEPASLALLTLSAAGLFSRRKRRMDRAAR